MPQIPLSNYPIRPLNKGMFRNLPPNGIPPGGFLRTQNMRIFEYGLERRHGMMDFDTNTSDQIKGPLLDIIHFYRRANQSKTLYLTEKELLVKDGVSLTSQNITYSVTVTGNTATANSTVTFTTDEPDLSLTLRQDDTLLVGTTRYNITSLDWTESVGTYTFTITINNSAPLSLDSLVGSQTILLNLKSVGNMTPSYALLPTTTSGDDKIVIADQADRGIYVYDAVDGFELFTIDSSVGGASNPIDDNITSLRTLTYFDGRIWAGNTVEVDGEHRQRIRWSDVNTYNRFRFENYIDLPYTEGQLLKLLPLGSLLVAYFEDAIYLGRFTNRPELPYFFTRMETGLVGPVSDRAVCKWVDMHYFVGSDDIYSMSEATGIQPIGAPIITETLEFTEFKNQNVGGRDNNNLLSKVKAVHDLGTESIAFLIPDWYDESSPIFGAAERIWRFFYKTQAWSYDEVYFNDDAKTDPEFLYLGLAASKVYEYGRSWDEWIDIDPLGEDVESDLARWERGDGTMDDGDAFSDYPTWYALIDETIKPRSMKLSLYKKTEDRIVITVEEKWKESDTIVDTEYPIWVVLESPDFDLGTPDITKTYNRLSLKSFRNRADRYSPVGVDSLTFTLFSSSDFGHTFKRPQMLRWRSNYNEGKADFRCSGSAYRFKLTSNAIVPSYKLSEVVLRTVSRGLQIQD